MIRDKFCIDALVLHKNKIREINALIVDKKSIVTSMFSSEQEKDTALNDLLEINNCFERWLKC
tara:strand:+ start:89 stop:277 length:189 start_codon:yes stop_codon:yes gene_type:complete